MRWCRPEGLFRGGEWDRNEGLRACGTPNPSLSDVAHEGLNPDYSVAILT